MFFHPWDKSHGYHQTPLQGYCKDLTGQHRGILNLQKDFRLMFLSASSTPSLKLRRTRVVSSEQRERARDKGCFEF